MFTMTIFNAGRTSIAEGESHPGERWEDMVLRLHRSTLPADAPLRQVIYVTYQTAQAGRATNTVVLGRDKSVTGEANDSPLLIWTNPPQF